MAEQSFRYSPTVFNIFKSAGQTSYDVVRLLKKILPGDFGKIGHFGTLDPFASGVLLVGVGGAARLNELIHEKLPKTYLAIGKLGVQTDSGDPTSPAINFDSSEYLQTVIAKFDKKFIEDFLRQKFLGDYWQSPPKHSATKFQGRALHEWAREGVEIKKEAVKRVIYKIEVVKYAFPYLSVRFEVGSGTYIRTLFEDCARELGTLGSLVGLVRESIGQMHMRDSLNLSRMMPRIRGLSGEEIMRQGVPIERVLKFGVIVLNEKMSFKFNNGVQLSGEDLKDCQRIGQEIMGSHRWISGKNSDRLLGLAEELKNGAGSLLRPLIIFS